MTRDEKLELQALEEERERRRVAESVDCSAMSREEAHAVYREVASNTLAMRKLCRTDLFYLLVYALKRRDADRDWLYARCREVQANPDGYLDLWARDHYKSTIITFALTIQDILRDPEVTFGIFSHTRPIAKAFLEQIKREFESNAELKALFPEILYDKPKSDSPKWSLDDGIVVRRKTNPKEMTIEAWGLVDGQPTSKHFSHQVFDDTVTLASVSTPEQIAKTTHAWSMALNLGSGERTKRRYIGTRYHLNDSYAEIMKREAAIPRIKPATHNGKAPPEGEPVFLSAEALAEKRRTQGPYTFGTQQLQDPVADKAMSFKREWVKYYEKLGDTSKWNRYLLADPASKKKKTSDYTTMFVVGLAPDQNYYVMGMLRDRLNLTQRASKVFELHREHQPRDVGYEEYGLQADIEHVQYEQEHRNYRFDIKALGGSLAKEDRIKKLIPLFEQGRVWMPRKLSYVDYEGRSRDLMQDFLDDEYLAFPVCSHDDMLDCLARILDPGLGAEFPKAAPPKPLIQHYTGGSSGWMS